MGTSAGKEKGKIKFRLENVGRISVRVMHKLSWLE